MSNKRHYKIKSWYISYLALLYPFIFSILTLIYIVFMKGNNIVFILMANAFFYLPFIFQIKHQKITLTNRKIYYYCFFRKKADISWDLYKQLRLVSYKQSTLGKVFGFGSITFVNRDEQALTVNMVRDVLNLYHQSIYYSTKYMLEREPEAELSNEIKEIIDLIENNKSLIDSVDSLDNVEQVEEEENQDGENSRKNNNNNSKEEKDEAEDKIDTLD